MMRPVACAALALGAVLVLAGCKSFSYRLGSPDPRPIHSVFVLVDAREKLKHDTLDEIKALVRPERYEGYAYFAQFAPEEASWSIVDRRGIVEPDVDGDHVSLTFPHSFIEQHEALDPQIAVVVRYTDNTWKCETDPLVAKGSAEYVITPTGLLPKR